MPRIGKTEQMIVLSAGATMRVAKCGPSDDTRTMNPTCVNGQCVDSETLTHQWKVDLEMDNVLAVDVNITEVLENIRTLSGLEKEMVVGIEIDENGYAMRIIVYTETEEMANIISG